MQDENEKQAACHRFTDKEHHALKWLAQQIIGWRFVGYVLRQAVVLLGLAAGALTAIKTLLGGL